jgi:hypothetical protein
MGFEAEPSETPEDGMPDRLDYDGVVEIGCYLLSNCQTVILQDLL